MKIIIMAAGRGTRISRHIHGKPKCCVEFEGEPLIHRTIRILTEMKIGEVAIVTGYQSGEVLKAMGSYQVAKFYNPFFDVTNSIASLWFARDFFAVPDDVIIMNGDLFMEKELVASIVDETRLPVFLADSSRIKEADYRFQWQDNILKKYGKELPNEETTGEYVGIGKIDRRFILKFIAKMDEMINSQQSGKWWEDILYSFIGTGTDVYVKDINGIFWAELDYIEDFQRIEKYLNENKPQ
ncbi:MAG: phosphocholine cytidylyltransferase family protein [Desulfobulbaceae bacterium]